MSKLIKPKNNYTTVTNNIINDDRLTLKAKGLYLFLLSKPDNWTFSARLIATQNKDAIASVNTGLQELEDVGLLSRIHVQSGYDYEIFDTFQLHLVENRLNGKSVKKTPKIDLIENRLNISNKELKANREEREIVITDFNPYSISSHNLISPYISFEVLSLAIDTDWEFSNEFFDYASKSAKNSLAYRSSLRDALFCTAHKKHRKTADTYFDFVSSRPDLKKNGVLPTGTNIFDLIGRD